MFRGFLLILLASANLTLGGGIQNLPALPNGAVANSVQVDASGNIYVVGSVTPANPKSSSDTADAFAAKLSSDGSQILWWTTFSGSSIDEAEAVALGTDSSVYVTGVTGSADFPTTSGSMQPVQGYQGPQAFAAKLATTGSVLYATFIGGPTQTNGNAIAVDASGNAYITGETFPTGFPTTPGAVAGDPSQNTAFILKLNTTGSTALVAIRGFGGKQIAVDAQGNVYAAGAFASAPGTETGPLAPTTAGAFQSRPANEVCVFTMTISLACSFQHIAKIDPSGTQLIYATYVSGSLGAVPQGMAVDSSGNVILGGITNSFDYPTTPGAYQPEYFGEPIFTFQPGFTENAPNSEGYVTKLNASGAGLLWSTYFGGSGAIGPGEGSVGGDTVTGMAIDPNGNILLAGVASSKDLPGLWATPVSSRPPPGQGFATRLTPDGTIISPTQLFLAPNRTFNAPTNIFVAGIAARADGSAIVFPPLATATFSSVGRVAEISDNADNAKLVSIAPGQLLTLYGTELAPSDPAMPSNGFPTAFNGVSVTFNGIAAPLLYTSGTQINLQVPYEVAGQSQVTMQVSSQFVSPPVSESYLLAVVDSQPSVFTSPNSNTALFADLTICNGQQVSGLQPLALNTDGTVNSCANPAASGSTVTIFLNALGVTSPTRATGAVSSSAVAIAPGATLLSGDPTAANILSTKTLPGSLASVAQVQIQVTSSSPFLNLVLQLASAGTIPVRGPGVVIWVKTPTGSASKLRDTPARRR